MPLDATRRDSAQSLPIHEQDRILPCFGGGFFMRGTYATHSGHMA